MSGSYGIDLASCILNNVCKCNQQQSTDEIHSEFGGSASQKRAYQAELFITDSVDCSSHARQIQLVLGATIGHVRHQVLISVNSVQRRSLTKVANPLLPYAGGHPHMQTTTELRCLGRVPSAQTGPSLHTKHLTASWHVLRLLDTVC